MNHLARVALLGLPCLLGSCSMLDGPMRTVQSAFRTLSDAGDASFAPPTLEGSDPAAVSLRLSTPRPSGNWTAPDQRAPITQIGLGNRSWQGPRSGRSGGSDLTHHLPH